MTPQQQLRQIVDPEILNLLIPEGKHLYSAVCFVYLDEYYLQETPGEWIAWEISSNEYDLNKPQWKHGSLAVLLAILHQREKHKD